MEQIISALLVHDQSELLGALTRALETQSIRTLHVRTCRDASGLLAEATLPHLIFTDTTLPDGTWADVLTIAAKALQPVNVIVVARLAEMRLYSEVIQKGAFDFIAPPFLGTDLLHVVHCAVDNGLRRRIVHRQVA